MMICSSTLNNPKVKLNQKFKMKTLKNKDQKLLSQKQGPEIIWKSCEVLLIEFSISDRNI